MKEVDVLHVSVLALLLELLHGFFLVLCENVDSALLAHKTVSVHSCNVLIVVVLLLNTTPMVSRGVTLTWNSLQHAVFLLL